MHIICKIAIFCVYCITIFNSIRHIITACIYYTTIRIILQPFFDIFRIVFVDLSCLSHFFVVTDL